MDADERQLVEAAQRDPSRFGDLYERHFERVYAYIVRRVGNRPSSISQGRIWWATGSFWSRKLSKA